VAFGHTTEPTKTLAAGQGEPGYPAQSAEL